MGGMKLALLSALLLPLGTLQADEAPADRNGKVWVMMGSIPKGFGGDHQLIIDGKSQDLPTGQRTTVGPVPISSSATIKVEKEGLNLLETHVPKEMDESLAILMPTPADDGKLSLDVCFIDLKQFTKGSWLLANRTTSEIRIKLGEQEVVLKPGEDHILRKNPDSEPKSESLSYEHRKDGDEPWRLLSSSTASIHPQRREVCFFVNDLKTKRVNYYGVTLTIQQ